MMMNFIKKLKRKRQELKTQKIKNKYGMDFLKLNIDDEDMSWICKPYKKVILTNVKECKGITLEEVANRFKGLRKTEWEHLLSFQFMSILIEALEKNKNEADITKIFSIEICGSQDQLCTQENIRRHLLKIFEVVNETSECLRLKFKL